MPQIAVSKTILKPAAIVLLVVYFLYLVLSRIPAEFAASAIHSNAPNFWMTGVKGSIWNGSASASQIDTSQKNIALGEVSWTLNPWSILIFSPCITFEATSGGHVVRGNACQSLFTGTSVSGVEAEIPVRTLQPLLQQIVPMPINGHTSINIAKGRFSGGMVKELEAQVSWLGAQVHDGTGMVSLGSLAAKAMPNNQGGVALKLFELDGPFGLDLDVDWAVGSEDFNVSGTVSPKEGAPEIIGQALALVGGEEKELDSGVFYVTWPPQ